MIYKDVYHFLLRKASSKEVDIVLNMINKTDWGSVLITNEKDLAKETGTTEKYVKEVIKKFSSVYKNKRIITENKYSEEYPYKLLIGKSNIFYKKGDTYGRKFTFLYKKPFQSLSIYGKRLILSAVMNISLTGDKKTYIRVGDFVYRNEIDTGLIPSRRVLIRTLQEINRTFKGDLSVNYASSVMTKEEVINVNFKNEYIKEEKHNYTERFKLRKALFQYGYCDYLEDKYCIELEKVGKYIYNDFIKWGKQEECSLDDVLYIAEQVYKRSIKKLAKKIKVLLDRGNKPKQVSAYFSSIVFSEVVNEMVKYENQFKSITSLYEQVSIYGKTGYIRKRKEEIKGLFTVIQKWLESWMISRVKSDIGNKFINEEHYKKNKKLKGYLKNTFSKAEEYLRNWGNKVIKIRGDGGVLFLKEQIDKYLDIKNDGMLTII